VIQLHSGDYRNPSQLQEGAVLVVGAGNSGSEIALEAAQAGHHTWLAGRSTGEVPPAAYSFDGRLFWFVANKVLTVGTQFGRKARGPILSKGGPLINLKRQDVIRAGVEATPRVTSVIGGRPQLEDGRRLDVANVIWCTGFGHDFSWIRLPVLDADGMPNHERGVVDSELGLYFVGLPFLSKFASAFVGGVGEDAAAIVQHAAVRLTHRADTASPEFRVSATRGLQPSRSPHGQTY
jgi:putative flavoprotein involved in K+ transport